MGRKQEHADPDEVVICRICGNEFANLTGHLIRIHEVSPEEYKEAFGVDYLMSMNLRRWLSRQHSKRTKPHERAPSKEAILDAVRELAAELPGSPSNHDFEAYRPSWSWQAMHLFGNWTEVLLAAGLEPKDRIKWTRTTVQEAIKAREERGEPLYAWAVSRDECTLYQGACSVFGSWAEALSELGYDYATIRGNPSPEDDHRVPERLAAWIEENGALNWTRLRNTDNALLKDTVRVYNSLRNAAESLYLPLEETNHSWSRERVLKEARKRLENGRPIYDRALRREEPALWGAVHTWFEGFDGFYAALGLSREEAGAGKLWREGELEEALRQWSETHGPVYGPLLKRTRPDLYERIHCTRRRLHEVAEAAGLPFRVARRQWSRERVIDEFSAMAKEQLPLTSAAVRARSGKLYKACRRLFGSFRNALAAYRSRT